MAVYKLIQKLKVPNCLDLLTIMNIDLLNTPRLQIFQAKDNQFVLSNVFWNSARYHAHTISL